MYKTHLITRYYAASIFVKGKYYTPLSNLQKSSDWNNFWHTNTLLQNKQNGIVCIAIHRKNFFTIHVWTTLVFTVTIIVDIYVCVCVCRHCAKEALIDLCRWLHHGGEVAVSLTFTKIFSFIDWLLIKALKTTDLEFRNEVSVFSEHYSMKLAIVLHGLCERKVQRSRHDRKHPGQGGWSYCRKMKYGVNVLSENWLLKSKNSAKNLYILWI